MTKAAVAVMVVKKEARAREAWAKNAKDFLLLSAFMMVVARSPSFFCLEEHRTYRTYRTYSFSLDPLQTTIPTNRLAHAHRNLFDLSENPQQILPENLPNILLAIPALK